MNEDSGTGLAIVCRWTPEEFGEDKNTSKDIRQHWFVLHVLDDEEITNPYEVLDFYRDNLDTPLFLEVVNYFCLPGQEMVGICKTFWLKMIQRKWKKIYDQRRQIIKERSTPKSIMYRERNGCWPTYLNTMPSLVGMLT